MINNDTRLVAVGTAPTMSPLAVANEWKGSADLINSPHLVDSAAQTVAGGDDWRGTAKVIGIVARMFPYAPLL